MDFLEESVTVDAAVILARILKDWRIFLIDQQLRREEHLGLIKLFKNQRVVISNLTARVSELQRKNGFVVQENMDLRKQLKEQEEDYRLRLHQAESCDVAVQVSPVDFCSLPPIHVGEKSIPSDSSSLSDNCSVSSGLNDFDLDESSLPTAVVDYPTIDRRPSVLSTIPKAAKRSQNSKACSGGKQTNTSPKSAEPSNNVSAEITKRTPINSKTTKVATKQPLKPVNAAPPVGRVRKRSTKASASSSPPEVVAEIVFDKQQIETAVIDTQKIEVPTNKRVRCAGTTKRASGVKKRSREPVSNSKPRTKRRKNTLSQNEPIFQQEAQPEPETSIPVTDPSQDGIRTDLPVPKQARIDEKEVEGEGPGCLPVSSTQTGSNQVVHSGSDVSEERYIQDQVFLEDVFGLPVESVADRQVEFETDRATISASTDDHLTQVEAGTSLKVVVSSSGSAATVDARWYELFGSDDEEENDLEAEAILGEFRMIADQLDGGPMSPLSPMTAEDESL